MPYYPINVKLSKDQMKHFIDAIQRDERIYMTFTPKQIGVENSDVILVTKKQYNNLLLSKHSKKNITILFNKTQLRLMSKQIGNGILDSLGSFFKSATNSVKQGVKSVKNYFTKKPVQIEMKSLNKQQKTNNKAQAFFDDNKNIKKTNMFTPTDHVRLEKLNTQAFLPPLPKQSVSEYSPPNLSKFQSPINLPIMNHQKIKNPPMTNKDRAIADWLTQKQLKPKTTIFDKVNSGFDKLHNRVANNDFNF